MNAPSPADALTHTWRACATADWTGWDPYDGLMLRRWPATLLRRSRAGRLALIQGMRRLPINLRPLLGVPRTCNPKSLALGLDACCRLGSDPAWRSRVEVEAPRLVDRLLDRARPTAHGAGWGYPFDWQARAFWIPKDMPTVVCTGFVVRALDRACDCPVIDEQRIARIRAAVVAAAGFVLHDLHRSEEPVGFCWSYSPVDRAKIANATLLGAEVLGRAARLAGRPEWLLEAAPTVAWVLSRQREDGGWAYGDAAHHRWEDGLHTGFNLLSLLSIRTTLEELGLDTERTIPLESLRRGAAHYASRFFDAHGRPWSYSHTPWPLDTHTAAVAILALLACRRLEPRAGVLASQVLAWSLRHLWLDEGRFAYQLHRGYTIRTQHLRWCQAWMLRALAEWQAVAQEHEAGQGEAGRPGFVNRWGRC